MNSHQRRKWRRHIHRFAAMIEAYERDRAEKGKAHLAAAIQADLRRRFPEIPEDLLPRVVFR